MLNPPPGEDQGSTPGDLLPCYGWAHAPLDGKACFASQDPAERARCLVLVNMMTRSCPVGQAELKWKLEEDSENACVRVTTPIPARTICHYSIFLAASVPNYHCVSPIPVRGRRGSPVTPRLTLTHLPSCSAVVRVAVLGASGTLVLEPRGLRQR